MFYNYDVKLFMRQLLIHMEFFFLGGFSKAELLQKMVSQIKNIKKNHYYEIKKALNLPPIKPTFA